MSETKSPFFLTLHKLISVTLFFVLSIFFPQATYAVEVNSQYVTFFNIIAHHAKLSYASYREEQDIQKLLESRGDELLRYGNLPELKIRYFLTGNKENKTQTIVIRGTTNLENALTGFDLKLTENEVTGTRIHNGFSKAASAVFNEVSPLLNKSYKISLTGHSLGGAVAQVTALYLDVNNYAVQQVITFGQPKVTNIAGVLKFRYLNIIRVVTPQDMVPLVPPLDPMDINDLDIYWHAGQEVILLGDNNFSLTSGINSMLRATKIFDTQLGDKNLTLHQMSEYLNLVSDVQDDPKEIPYKNDFSGVKSLFGFE